MYAIRYGIYFLCEPVDPDWGRSMIVKIFSSIFRIDYQLSYKILDHLGQQLEEIIDRTKEKPFSETNGKIDLLNHSISSQGKVNCGRYLLNLSINSFDGTVENKDGYEIDRYCKNPVFNLADHIISNLDFKSFKRFNRIGFRSFLVIYGVDIKYDKVLRYFKKINTPFVKMIENNFSDVDDAGVVLECFDDSLGNIRLSIGPYGAKDQKQFFGEELVCKEGIMLDIDWWHEKIEIPGIKLSEIAKKCQDIYNKVVSNIESGILKEIT